MATSTRKQREIEAREELILDVARAMLLERGYLGVTMDRIAQAVEFSKGTIYQHFSSKEDLLIALAVQTAERRSRLFDRAAAFSGGTRERVAAIGLAYQLFVTLYPDHFRSEQLIHAGSLRAKARPERDAQLRIYEDRCMAALSGVIRDAVARGDVALPEDVEIEYVCFGLWSMSFGSYFLIASGIPLEEKGIREPTQALWANVNAMLDGYGWRPLSTGGNDPALFERIYAEVFPDELARINDR